MSLMNAMLPLCRRFAAASMLLVAGMCLTVADAAAQGGGFPVGAVFTATNDVNRNEVVMYQRTASGRLRLAGRFATGGRGEGGVNDPMQSQNSIVITEDHSRLLVVNAGSSNISVFRITPDGLLLASVTPSEGGNPVSLAVHDDLVYVVNFGGNYHTAGFRLQAWGGLNPIPNSRRTLSNLDPGASTVAFNPDGSKLVISERTANKIDVFDVNSNGTLSNPVFNNSAGVEPFGLTFTPSGALLVTETNGGPPNGGSVSSYTTNPDNSLSLVTAKADASGGAACWVVTDGRHAWISNTLGNSSVGLLQVSAAGSLDNPRRVANEPPPPDLPSAFALDSSLTSDNKFLYVLYSGVGKIVGYRVADDGGLTPITSVNPDKPSMGNQGMAAY